MKTLLLILAALFAGAALGVIFEANTQALQVSRITKTNYWQVAAFTGRIAN